MVKSVDDPAKLRKTLADALEASERDEDLKRAREALKEGLPKNLLAGHTAAPRAKVSN